MKPTGWILLVICVAQVSSGSNSCTCDNGGTCIYQNHCICPADYYGSRCELLTGCVESNPCQNGGTCTKPSISTIINYKCECTAGFAGENCTQRNPCASSRPCQNSGTCEAVFYGSKVTYRCRCQPGFYGRNCEKRSQCLGSNPCQNGGSCKSPNADDLVNYRCICLTDYYGVNCEKKSSCSDLNPCQNNATCRAPLNSEFKTYKCSCPFGYTGQHCEHEDPCHNPSGPCEQGEYCMAFFDAKVNRYNSRCACLSDDRGGCELDTCSVKMQCFTELMAFLGNLGRYPLDYQQCREYGDDLVDRMANCQQKTLRDLALKKDCNCDPYHTTKILSDRYTLHGVSAKDIVASNCLATVFGNNPSDTSLPKCPQRTIECFWYIRKFPYEEKAQKCIEDFFSGDIDFSNCEFLRAGFLLDGKLEYYMAHKLGCSFKEHWDNCAYKYTHLWPCRLQESTLTTCVLEALKNDKACQGTEEEQQKIINIPLLMKHTGLIAHPNSDICQSLTSFKDQYRSNWNCPADDKWEKIVNNAYIVRPTTLAFTMLVSAIVFTLY